MWTKTIHEYVIKITEMAKTSCEVHSKKHREYDRYHKFFMNVSSISSIGVTSLSGLNFIDGEQFFPITLAILSGLSSICISVAKFGKFSELAQKHQEAAANYSSLVSNVMTQLSLPTEERSNAKKYMRWVGEYYETIVQSSPFIPNTYTFNIDFLRDADIDVPEPVAITVPSHNKEESSSSSSTSSMMMRTRQPSYAHHGDEIELATIHSPKKTKVDNGDRLQP